MSPRPPYARAGHGASGVARALDEADAVIVASAPAAGDRWSRGFASVVRCVSSFGSNVAPSSLDQLDLLLVGATNPSASAWERLAEHRAPPHDLASETPRRFLDALHDRLAAGEARPRGG